jgi:hypothetical protein
VVKTSSKGRIIEEALKFRYQVALPRKVPRKRNLAEPQAQATIHQQTSCDKRKRTSEAAFALSQPPLTGFRFSTSETVFTSDSEPPCCSTSHKGQAKAISPVFTLRRRLSGILCLGQMFSSIMLISLCRFAPTMPDQSLHKPDVRPSHISFPSSDCG